MTEEFRLVSCEDGGYSVDLGLSLPEFAGTTRALIEIVRRADPALLIAAQTLPEENVSTTILRKPGFRLHGSVQHPEDGEIWEWRFEDSN